MTDLNSRIWEALKQLEAARERLLHTAVLYALGTGSEFKDLYQEIPVDGNEIRLREHGREDVLATIRTSYSAPNIGVELVWGPVLFKFLVAAVLDDPGRGEVVL